MNKPLEELNLENGKFINSSGQVVTVIILDLTIASAGKINPFFWDYQIPGEANAFVQGQKFDYNNGYVAPTLFLEIKKIIKK